MKTGRRSPFIIFPFVKVFLEQLALWMILAVCFFIDLLLPLYFTETLVILYLGS